MAAVLSRHPLRDVVGSRAHFAAVYFPLKFLYELSETIMTNERSVCLLFFDSYGHRGKFASVFGLFMKIAGRKAFVRCLAWKTGIATCHQGLGSPFLARYSLMRSSANSGTTSQTICSMTSLESFAMAS